jgi:hypothetical protein
MANKYKSDNEKLSFDNDQLGENKNSTGGKQSKNNNDKGKASK